MYFLLDFSTNSGEIIPIYYLPKKKKIKMSEFDEESDLLNIDLELFQKKISLFKKNQSISVYI